MSGEEASDYFQRSQASSPKDRSGACVFVSVCVCAGVGEGFTNTHQSKDLASSSYSPMSLRP